MFYTRCSWLRYCPPSPPSCHSPHIRQCRHGHGCFRDSAKERLSWRYINFGLMWHGSVVHNMERAARNSYCPLCWRTQHHDSKTMTHSLVSDLNSKSSSVSHCTRKVKTLWCLRQRFFQFGNDPQNLKYYQWGVGWQNIKQRTLNIENKSWAPSFLLFLQKIFHNCCHMEKEFKSIQKKKSKKKIL